MHSHIQQVFVNNLSIKRQLVESINHQPSSELLLPIFIINIMSNSEISHELYKWLSTMQVLPNSLKYKSNGNFELDTKSSDGLLSGHLIAKLLIRLASDQGATVNLPLLSSVKQSNTPAARLYNWNILTESFLKLNVNVSKETQKEITTGNFSTMVRFLLQLHQKFNPKKAEKKETPSDSSVNFKKLQQMQGFAQAETMLEMVVMMISQTLNLTPKQVVSTLSDNAKYYAHIIVKGVKNSFGEVITLLNLFIKEMPNLMYQCQKSPQKNTEFFLDLIKPTLISRDLDVSIKGTELFQAFIEQSIKYNSKNLIYQILCKEDVGFDFLYMGLKRHPDLVHEYTNFIFPLIRDAFKDFFEIHLKRTINNEQQYLKIVIKLLEGLTSHPQSKAKLKESGLLQIWLKSSQQSFNNKKNKEQNLINEETKLLYLQLLCNLWKDYSAQINQEQAEELLMKGIQQLKKNTRKEIYTIKIPAMLRLFDFLHFLADAKNKVSAILYKKLIFLFIENHDSQEIREIILSNFTIMVQSYPTIPIQFLLEPFLKQLINSEGKTYILNLFDFQFMIELCKHPRMDATYGLSYLQYLSKLYIKSFIYSKIIIRVIELLTNRFCEEETIIQFLKKTVLSTLNLYGILIFNRKKLSKQDNIINKQKKSLAIELIKHFIQLQHRELAQFILHEITNVYVRWVEENRYTDKGLTYLINLYGDVDQICLQFKIGQNKTVSNELPVESEPSASNSYTPLSQQYKQMEYMKEKGIGYKAPNKVSKTRLEELIEKNMLKPSPKVLEDIEKLKERLKQDAYKKKVQQNNELKKISQQKNQNQMELYQRNLSLGYAKLTPLMQGKKVFEYDSINPKQLKPTYKFHQLNQLEEVDESTANTILKTYAKEIKSLFLKYALISSSNDKKKDAPAMLSFTEVIRMLKEKSINVVSKLMVSDLLSSINHNKREEKNVLSGVEEADFNEFLIKLTDCIIQQERSVTELPFGLKLESVLKLLFKNQNFYQFKFRNKQDPKITKLKQVLNSPEQQQTNVQIPEGYKKVKQNHVELQYILKSAEEWGIQSNFQTVYEITDWLIHRCIGIHVMSPCVEINPRYNLIQIPKQIRPRVPKQQTDARIKYEPDTNVQQDLNLSEPTEKKQSVKSKRIQRPPQKRSASQMAINKTKTDPYDESAEQQKIKAQKKREAHALKVKQSLQKLREQKNQKGQQERAKKQLDRQKQRRKQEERKRYLDSNKQKLKQAKLKQEEERMQKEEEDKVEKERLKEEQKRREKQILEKNKVDIRRRAEKVSDRKKELENSKEKKANIYQKLLKEALNARNQVPNDTALMAEVKKSLQNGGLKDIVNKYEKQLTELFQNYWIWDKKRIELNSLAIMLKDFHITPEYLYPKILSETYKNIAKGENLDFKGFTECLIKCAYRSQKIKEQSKEVPTEGLNEDILKIFLDKLRMKEENYKQVIKAVKNHI